MVRPERDVVPACRARGQSPTTCCAAKVLDGRGYYRGFGTTSLGRTHDVAKDGRFLMIRENGPADATAPEIVVLRRRPLQRAHVLAQSGHYVARR